MKVDPDISIVVASHCGDATLRRCLDRLLKQALTLGDVEIIVGIACGESEFEGLVADYPAVKFLLSQETPSQDPRIFETIVFRLRSLGVAAAKGRLVILTEDHIAPGPGWLDAFKEGHLQEDRIVGGPIDPGDSASLYVWALYLCEYVQLICPMPQGPAAYISGVNIGYRRESLEQVRDTWNVSFFENEVNDHLVAAGHQLWLEPDAFIASELLFPFKKARCHLHTGGWRFGCFRKESSTRAQLWKWRLTLPLVPAFHLWRIFKVMATRRPKSLLKLALGLPIVLTLVLSWSIGEARGLLGKGKTTDFCP